MKETYSMTIIKREFDRLQKNPTQEEQEDEFTADKINDLYWTIKHLEEWELECKEETETDYTDRTSGSCF